MNRDARKQASTNQNRRGVNKNPTKLSFSEQLAKLNESKGTNRKPEIMGTNNSRQQVNSGTARQAKNRIDRDDLWGGKSKDIFKIVAKCFNELQAGEKMDLVLLTIKCYKWFVITDTDALTDVNLQSFKGEGKTSFETTKELFISALAPLQDAVEMEQKGVSKQSVTWGHLSRLPAVREELGWLYKNMEKQDFGRCLKSRIWGARFESVDGICKFLLSKINTVVQFLGLTEEQWGNIDNEVQESMLKNIHVPNPRMIFEQESIRKRTYTAQDAKQIKFTCEAFYIAAEVDGNFTASDLVLGNGTLDKAYKLLTNELVEHKHMLRPTNGALIFDLDPSMKVQVQQKVTLRTRNRKSVQVEKPIDVMKASPFFQADEKPGDEDESEEEDQQENGLIDENEIDGAIEQEFK
jgi:hypothetical protein